MRSQHCAAATNPAQAAGNCTSSRSQPVLSGQISSTAAICAGHETHPAGSAGCVANQEHAQAGVPAKPRKAVRFLEAE